jgi:uncharacterized integral membrane protein
MNDLISYFAWLYADFPTKVDFLILGFLLGGIFMFGLAKLYQKLEERAAARLDHLRF